MKAVYECKENPYLTLSLDEVVPIIDILKDGAVVWLRRNPPQAVQFIGGTLTLTDPTAIRGMREYINRRAENDKLISELSFEGDEAELGSVPYPPYPLKPKLAQEGSKAAQEVPQNKHEVDRADEWDRTYEKMLKSR